MRGSRLLCLCRPAFTYHISMGVCVRGKGRGATYELVDEQSQEIVFLLGTLAEELVDEG